MAVRTRRRGWGEPHQVARACPLLRRPVRPDDAGMTLESAQRAGDAPGIAPDGDARRLAEVERWRRRRLLERQLHDGAALRISALSLRLGVFRHRAPTSADELREAVGGMQDELHAVLQELRDVAARIYPPLLDEAGLGPALRELTARIGVPARVHATDDRFGPAVEGAAYFAVAECLGTLDGTGPPVELLVGRDSDVLAVHVQGIDVRQAPRMLDHVRRMGGTVDVAGAPVPTTIIARIPCA
jgi:signal transduction histidine kinase